MNKFAKSQRDLSDSLSDDGSEWSLSSLTGEVPAARLLVPLPSVTEENVPFSYAEAVKQHATQLYVVLHHVHLRHRADRRAN